MFDRLTECCDRTRHVARLGKRHGETVSSLDLRSGVQLDGIAVSGDGARQVAGKPMRATVLVPIVNTHGQ